MSLDVICKAMGALCVILSREVKWSREKQIKNREVTHKFGIGHACVSVPTV